MDHLLGHLLGHFDLIKDCTEWHQPNTTSNTIMVVNPAIKANTPA